MAEEVQLRSSLSDLLGRVLNHGVLVRGRVLIKVANVDLAFIQLDALVTGVQTAIEQGLLETNNLDGRRPR